MSIDIRQDKANGQRVTQNKSARFAQETACDRSTRPGTLAIVEHLKILLNSLVHTD
jgi:hypothetical protein